MVYEINSINRIELIKDLVMLGSLEEELLPEDGDSEKTHLVLKNLFDKLRKNDSKLISYEGIAEVAVGVLEDLELLDESYEREGRKYLGALSGIFGIAGQIRFLSYADYLLKE